MKIILNDTQNGGTFMIIIKSHKIILNVLSEYERKEITYIHIVYSSQNMCVVLLAHSYGQA